MYIFHYTRWINIGSCYLFTWRVSKLRWWKKKKSFELYDTNICKELSNVPATRRIGGLSGWSSICLATYWPSKWAYHHPRFPPAFGVSGCPAAAGRTNGILKNLCEDSTINCFVGVRGVFAAKKIEKMYTSTFFLSQSDTDFDNFYI